MLLSVSTWLPHFVWFQEKKPIQKNTLLIMGVAGEFSVLFDLCNTGYFNCNVFKSGMVESIWEGLNNCSLSIVPA